MYEVGASDVTVRWSANVTDFSGLATATAFDFLGDAVAEAIYADETQIYVFDGQTGNVSLTAPRSSGTLIEYPVVADVDNDGSAEIVYVSNYSTGQTGPTVIVLRDATDRWIPARRIWNQYAYHVQRARRRHHPGQDEEPLAAPQHLPYQRPDRHRGRLHPRSAELGEHLGLRSLAFERVPHGI